jgi:hypothetical protein
MIGVPERKTGAYEGVIKYITYVIINSSVSWKETWIY